MPENIESAIIESDNRAPAVIPPKPKRRKEREKEFTDAIVVKRIGHDDLLVPLTEAGARNANLITAELCRDLVEKTIDDLIKKDKTPTPKELNDLASAAKTVGEMALKARGAGEEGSKGTGGALTAILDAAGKTPATMDEFHRLTIMVEKAGMGKKLKNITPDEPHD